MRFKRPAAVRRFTPTAASLAMFALLCATIVYWALQLLAPAVPIAPSGSLADRGDAPDLASAARLFGLPAGSSGAQASVAPPSNIQVLGVAASELRGSAVLAVDGKSPRAFMVGDAVSADAKLVEVRPGAVVIERNGARVELPAPQRPSVATLWAGPARAGESTSAAAAPPVPTAPPPPAAPVPPPAAGAAPSPQPAPGPLDLRTPGPAAAAPSAAPSAAHAQPAEPGAPAGMPTAAPAAAPAAAPTVTPQSQPSPQPPAASDEH